jgi:DNA polymerase I-like protein with 3'-5' exonuclease and polymerase domains
MTPKPKPQKPQLSSIRETFLPDLNPDGSPQVFVRCDMSQIEDRIGKMYCATPRMIELANRHPTIYDAHTENAKAIFKKSTIDKQERYLGKKAVHASWRGMRGDKLSESVSKDTDGKLFVPAGKCQDMIDIFLDTNWEIRDIYMPWVRKQVREVGILYNSFGRRLDVQGRRVDDDLYRAAYSFYPQADCADWCNQFGFLPGSVYMQARYNKPLTAQVHDEVIASVPIMESWDFARFITDALEQTKEIPRRSGNYLKVPAGITIGRSWGDLKSVEFKLLPGRDGYFEQLKSAGFELY